MTAREILFGEDARNKMMSGIEQLNNAVRITLGPDGQNVIIDRLYSAPRSTKDGVTVAKEIFLADRFENIGAQMLKQVALKSSEIAGDGTTTATLIGNSLFKEGQKAISNGINPVKLKRGLKMAVSTVVDHIKSNSIPVSSYEDLLNVATISSNNDKEIGKIVADAFTHAGKDGFVNFVEGSKTKTELRITDGITFNRGFIDPSFITDYSKQTCEYSDVQILFMEGKFESEEKITSFLTRLVKEAPRIPTLIICDDVNNYAISKIVANNVRGSITVCCVRAPSFRERRRELLEDMAIITGGKLVPLVEGKQFDKAFDVSQLGRASQIIVSKDRTVILGGKGSNDAIAERKAQITAYLAELTERDDADAEEVSHVKERLANFNGMALISVGGKTEPEMRECYYRVEDAVHATRAAMEEGILPGGGVALLRASNSVDSLLKDDKLHDDVKFGVKMLKNVLDAPCHQIATNAGMSGDAVVAAIQANDEYTYGYDAYNDSYGNMIEKGIIDPTKVVRSALEGSSSVVEVLLTTGAVICSMDQESANRAFPMMV